MFDRDDYIYEEESLNYNQVDIIRTALEDIIERVYRPTIINEEVDMQIRKMADQLGVYVPKFFCEFMRIEDILNRKVRPMDHHFYSNWDTPLRGIIHLTHTMREELQAAGLSSEEINEFCTKPEYKCRVAEAKCALNHV
jgi:hypothetical protein